MGSVHAPVELVPDICAGSSQENTAKAEDVFHVTIGAIRSIAAVFDGHGGKRAAQLCEQELVPTLLSAGLGISLTGIREHSGEESRARAQALGSGTAAGWGAQQRGMAAGLVAGEAAAGWGATARIADAPVELRSSSEGDANGGLPPDAAVVNAFWDMDRRIGGGGIDDGTTATVLLISRPSATTTVTPGIRGTPEADAAAAPATGGPPTFRCALAWVGDSSALRVDMTAAMADALVPGSSTAKHQLSNDGEVRRLQLEWSVRAQIERDRGAQAQAGPRCGLDSPATLTPACPACDSPASTSTSMRGAATGTTSAPHAPHAPHAPAPCEGRRSVLLTASGREGASSSSFSSSARVSRVPSAPSVGSSAETSIGASDVSFIARRVAPGRGEVECAVRAAGHAALGEEELTLLVRALAREKRIELPHLLREIEIDSSPGALSALRRVVSRPMSAWPAAMLPSRTAEHRNESFIGVNPRSRSPVQRLYAPRVANGDVPVSVAMTRSIGDWDASRAMVPHPELQHFQVGPGAFQRVVLASDGVWDFVSEAEAACAVRNARTAQAAADALVRLASAKSMAKLNRLKDDTSCVVVDLNPSRRAFEPAAAASGCGGCTCAIS